MMDDMTSATAGGHAGRGSLIHRAAMWAGHHHPRVMPPALGILLAASIVTTWTWTSASPALQLTISAVSIVSASIFLITIIASTLVHDRNLCERDFDDTLLDPQGEVERYDRQLRTYHRSPWMTSLSLLAAVALLSDQIVATWPWPARAAVTAASIGVFTVLVHHAMAVHTHRRLSRWCPYCRRRGPGTPVVAPPPQPVSTNTR